MLASAQADLQEAHQTAEASENEWDAVPWLQQPPVTVGSSSSDKQIPDSAAGPSKTCSAKQQQKQSLVACVKEQKAMIKGERQKHLQQLREQKHAAMEEAAMQAMAAACKKVRITGKKPKCRLKCHGVWHQEDCPNHPSNQAIAKQALGQRMHPVGKALSAAFGPTPAKQFLEALK